MKDYYVEQAEMKEDRAKLARDVKKIITYPILADGLVRIVEANVPAEYTEIVKTIRQCGETLYGMGITIGTIGLATPFYGWTVALEIYKGLRGR